MGIHHPENTQPNKDLIEIPTYILLECFPLQMNSTLSSCPRYFAGQGGLLPAFFMQNPVS